MTKLTELYIPMFGFEERDANPSHILQSSTATNQAHILPHETHYYATHLSTSSMKQKKDEWNPKPNFQQKAYTSCYL